MIYILGANSLIGRHVLKSDRLKGQGIRCVSRSAAGKSLKGHYDDWFEGSIDVALKEDPWPTSRSTRSNVAIILAWQGRLRSKDIECGYNSRLIRAACRFSRQIDASQVIFLSTAGGLYSDNLCVDEECVQERSFLSDYANEKLDAEDYIRRFARDNLMEACILRVSTAYGLSEDDKGVVKTWFSQIEAGEEITVVDRLDSTINFISYEDIVDAIVVAIGRKLSGVYNVGSCTSQTLRDVLRIIESVLGKKAVGESSRLTRSRRFEMSVEKWERASGREYEGVNENTLRKMLNRRLNCGSVYQS